MKLSQYKFIVVIERKDFRSRNPGKTTFRRRGFQTREAAERYLSYCRSSKFVYAGWIQ